MVVVVGIFFRCCLIWIQFKRVDNLGNIILCKRIGVRGGVIVDIIVYLRNNDQVSLVEVDDSYRGEMKVRVGKIGKNQILEDLVFQFKEFKFCFVSYDSY